MYLSAINAIKRKYEMGTVIVLEQLGEDPRPVGPGSKGEVLYVDDIGTVHVRFENGRRMGLVPGEDLFHIENGDPEGDVFRVYPEEGFAEQVYYNPDIGDGGQYVVNFFTFRQVQKAADHAKGDPKKFFRYLETVCRQLRFERCGKQDPVDKAAKTYCSETDHLSASGETMRALLAEAEEYYKSGKADRQEKGGTDAESYYKRTGV
jgi:hypothetical protein